MYALASVLQQRSAAVQPVDQALRLSLLGGLLRNPSWLLGLGCDILGYVLQFIALGHGPLVVVQPLLVCGLLFALPMAAAWSGRRLERLDWIAAVLVCVGLAVFLVVASPEAGHDNVATVAWIALLGSSAALTLGLVASSTGRLPWQRAVMLSGAAGVLYGVAAALTKTCSHLLDGGVISLLGHWQPYALVVAGIAGLVIGQSAFQAGSLAVSLPAMSVVDPIVSIVIGALAFGESLAAGPGHVVIEVAALVAMSTGVVLLARAEADRQLTTRPAPSRSSQ
jgi:drug/metabolite transporter (DMT)-like permease